MHSSNHFYVYMLFHPVTGQPFYVGKGKDLRYLDHGLAAKRGKHTNIGVQEVYDFAFKMMRDVPTVIVRNKLKETEAFELEIEIIRVLRRVKDGGCLANQTLGGDGVSGYTYTETHRARHKAALKKAYSDPALREKLRQIVLEANANPEIRKRKGRPGRTFSEESRKKMRLSHLGKTLPKEQIDKITSKTRGKKRTEQQKKNISDARKRGIEARRTK